MEPRQHSIQGIATIARNSLTVPYQELPDSGKAELVDPSAPVAHELMSQRLSNETSRLQNHDPRSKHTTSVSSNMSTQSWTCIGRFFNIKCAKIQELKKIDLDRPLPPLPSSASSHHSPLVVNFNRVTASRRGSSESGYEATAHVSRPTHLKAWQRRFAYSSHSSMDMEIVMSPGLSEVEIIKPLM